MTHDFKEDLIEAAKREGKMFLIVIFEGDMSGAIVSASEELDMDEALKAVRAAMES